MHIAEKTYLESLSITEESDIYDDRYGIDQHQTTEIYRCYEKAIKAKSGGDEYIRRRMRKYPKTPVFLNYLSVWYSERGRRDEAEAVMRKAVDLHPDYIIAQTGLADLLIGRGENEGSMALLGPDLRIDKRFPNVDIFHRQEVISYETVSIRCLLHDDKLDMALEKYNDLKDLFPMEPRLEAIGEIFIQHSLSKLTEEFEARSSFFWDGEEPLVTSTSYVARPKLRLAESQWIYADEQELDMAQFKQLLACPAEDLLHDTCAIVEYGIRAFGYIESLVMEAEIGMEHTNFVNDALLLMSTIDDDHALETSLHYLSCHSDIIDFYTNDYVTEEIWKCLYRLAPRRFEYLIDFVTNEKVYVYHRTCVSQALVVLYKLRTELQHEIAEWYHGFLNYVLSQETDSIEPQLTSNTVCDLAELNLDSLKNQVKQLYDGGYLLEDITGPYDEMMNFWNEDVLTRHEYENLDPVIQFKAYLKDRKKWRETQETQHSSTQRIELEEDQQLEDKRESYLGGREPLSLAPDSTPKVGRNEPCPCGSRKKYKKCCL